MVAFGGKLSGLPKSTDHPNKGSRQTWPNLIPINLHETPFEPQSMFLGGPAGPGSPEKDVYNMGLHNKPYVVESCVHPE